MPRLPASFCVAVLCLVLAACATTALETNKDAANLKTLEKVYVVANTGNVKLLGSTSPSLGEYLSSTVTARLSKRSVDAKGVQLGGMDLNLTQDNLEKDIAAYGATQVMSIELTGGTVEPYTNVLHSGDIVVTIFDVRINKAVWKAKIHVQAFSGWGVPEATMGDSVDKVFTAMQADGLLLQAAPSTGS